MPVIAFFATLLVICVLFLYGAILDGIFRQLKRIADALEKRP